jgi:hypothetical protein
MSIDSYAGLLQAVGDYAVRTDMGARAPEFVALAEARLNRVLRVRPMVGRTALSLGAEYVSLPADYLGVRTLSLDGSPRGRLEFVTPDQMDQLKASRGAAGRPEAYAIAGTELRLHPAPDAAYGAELSYFRRLPPLASNTSNWLLAAAPDAYLYGALVQLGILTEDERLPAWSEAWNAAIGELTAADPAETLPPALTPAPTLTPV